MQDARAAGAGGQTWGGEGVAVSPAFLCCLNIVAAVFLQRFVVPLGGEAAVSIHLPLAVLSLLWLFAGGMAVIDTIRLVACLAFLGSAVVSQILGGNDFSPASIALLAAIYLPITARIPITSSEYGQILNCFQYSMAIVALLAVMQYGMQLAGLAMPILEDFIPEILIVKNFVYLQEVLWQSGLFKANGMVMLEPSFLSQFLALALIVEYWCLRRPLWMLLYGSVLVLTFSGTGMLLAAISLGFMVWKRGTDRYVLLLALASGCVVAALAASGWLTALSGRLAEFNDPDASASLRFSAPFERVYDTLLAGDLNVLLFGAGAGSIEEVGFAWNPPVKVWVEYGALVCVIYVGFLVTVFRKAPIRMLSLAFALEYLFFGGGALLQPPIVFAGFFMVYGYIATRPASSRFPFLRTR